MLPWTYWICFMLMVTYGFAYRPPRYPKLTQTGTPNVQSSYDEQYPNNLDPFVSNALSMQIMNNLNQQQMSNKQISVIGPQNSMANEQYSMIPQQSSLTGQQNYMTGQDYQNSYTGQNYQNSYTGQQNYQDSYSGQQNYQDSYSGQPSYQNSYTDQQNFMNNRQSTMGYQNSMISHEQTNQNPMEGLNIATGPGLPPPMMGPVPGGEFGMNGPPPDIEDWLNNLGGEDEDVVMQNFRTSRRRGVFRMLKDEDEEDVTWKDYFENSVDWTICEGLVNGLSFVPSVLPNVVFRNWAVSQLCQEVFFQIVVPMLTKHMLGYEYDDWRF